MATSQFKLPGYHKMANKFIGAKSSKTVKFMDKDLEITKLTINQVLRIQDVTKKAESESPTTSNITILSAVIREGAIELRDLDQTDLQDFPMEELASLSNQIMEFSGLSPKTE